LIFCFSVVYLRKKGVILFRVNACIKYGLPIPKDVPQRVGRTSSPAHVGRLRNAIDLIASQNTPVFAAADGWLPLSKMIQLLGVLTRPTDLCEFPLNYVFKWSALSI
jgi:hypothetical protein